MDDMSYSRSEAYNSKCYVELKYMDDMNYSGFYELKPLDLMNCLELWMM